jgi:hypothetical protein
MDENTAKTDVMELVRECMDLIWSNGKLLRIRL